MAPHSSTLAWKTPWTEEPGGLQSMGSLSQTRLSNFTFTFHFHALEKEMATHSSVLAWRVPGMGEPGGLQSCPTLQSHRVGHDWSGLAAAAAINQAWTLSYWSLFNLPELLACLLRSSMSWRSPGESLGLCKAVNSQKGKTTKIFLMAYSSKLITQ